MGEMSFKCTSALVILYTVMNKDNIYSSLNLMYVIALDMHARLLFDIEQQSRQNLYTSVTVGNGVINRKFISLRKKTCP